MKLYVKCTSCQKETSWISLVTDRGELAREHRDEVKVTCTHCKLVAQVSPDKVYMKPSQGLHYLSLLVAGGGCAFIYVYCKEMMHSVGTSILFIGMMLGPLILFQAIRSYDISRVKRFNSYRIKS